ncbi:MAG TPA: hypothetical protein VJZ78_01245 [Anaerolineales bacterium]|nr:hypothetical protein [Anaerolineales bacterium]
MADRSNSTNKPNIVFIIARGESVRNFLYSAAIRSLHENARITLLSVITDEQFRTRFEHEVDQIIELREYPEHRLVNYLRALLHDAHYRWLWTEKVKNKQVILDDRARTLGGKIKRSLWKTISYFFANQGSLSFLSTLDRKLSILLKPTADFDRLFSQLKPDLVFNGSHIHASRGDLPIRIAHQMGIPTATFIFSWDNLSSRARLLPHYDHYLVWHKGMKEQLLNIYPSIKEDHVYITGTPQFDFHFRKEYILPRRELCSRIGLDPGRPFILYTTGMARDFPGEYLHVRSIIALLHEMDETKRPQLVVRAYIKGNSPEMEELAGQAIPGVVFPPVLWEEKWFTPMEEDLCIYTSLLHYCELGINPASTVSLELMMMDKPVINIGFDPPGYQVAKGYHWSRHIQFDHYRDLVRSGAVKIAYSTNDMRRMIHDSLENPSELLSRRRSFLEETFGCTLDGNSAQRIAEILQAIISD